VPQASHASTEVSLLGTAGLRLLPMAQQEAILNTVRQLFKKKSFSDFAFKDENARVIPGSEEGLNDWMAVNYLLGSFNKPGSDGTVGVLDMGGASTEITFKPAEGTKIVADFYRQVLTKGESKSSYDVYSHSYLGLGVGQAITTFDSHCQGQPPVGTDSTWYAPCYLKGYQRALNLPLNTCDKHMISPRHLNGTGNFDKCVAGIKKILVDVHRKCTLPPCAFDGVYQPNLRGTDFAVKNAFYEVVP